MDHLRMFDFCSEQTCFYVYGRVSNTSLLSQHKQATWYQFGDKSMPPSWTNHLCWKQSFFLVISTWSISSFEILLQPVFQHLWKWCILSICVDENKFSMIAFVSSSVSCGVLNYNCDAVLPSLRRAGPSEAELFDWWVELHSNSWLVDAELQFNWILGVVTSALPISISEQQN